MVEPAAGRTTRRLRARMSGSAVRLVVHDRGHDLLGAVHEAESWAAAARRTVASRPVDPVPVDLSGEVKQFLVDHDNRVAVRPMTPGDLPDMARWLAADHVRRWWPTDDTTLEGVAARYGPSIDGMTPTRMYVAEVNGRSVGFLQDYRVRDHPDFAMLTPDPDAIGVDYAIGEPSWLGRGFGARLLWAWMPRALRRFPDARSLFAAPDHRNAASLRVLDKVGFSRGVWFDEPQSGGCVATVVGCTLDVATVLG
ncbi:GNAT family N-acetyltransferase [Nocardioides sp. cx-173]|uniref:GNAT family N-acetyltransferase n=1 Tax=Nocardioides sp. cx-173 TaxID=2898796 RepID=UPI001E434D43|nr:GNAT family N-acetyltransferase [Nocardioides sp. cx-173]MCD4525100.1 acetyltransferase [Nocardioides sp. cx-173]UGB40197.1 acetyltransferase [Nocardioides sp. cx-173]